MLLSERNQIYLDAMRLIESVSRLLKTTSWVWGGFTTDICMGRMLREHDDLDYLTLNLHQWKVRFEEAFSQHGWQTKNLANGDLKLKKMVSRCNWGMSNSVRLQHGPITVRRGLFFSPLPG